MQCHEHCRFFGFGISSIIFIQSFLSTSLDFHTWKNGLLLKRIFLVDANNTQLGHLITSGQLFVYCIVPPVLNTFNAIMPGE